MAESIPLATLVQKASEPLMNSLERGKGLSGWAGILHHPLCNPEPHTCATEERDSHLPAATQCWLCLWGQFGA